jgi:hypothetical protein
MKLLILIRQEIASGSVFTNYTTSSVVILTSDVGAGCRADMIRSSKHAPNSLNTGARPSIRTSVGGLTMTR